MEHRHEHHNHLGEHIHCECGCCDHDEQEHDEHEHHHHEHDHCHAESEHCHCHSEVHDCHSELDSESPLKKILLAFVIFAAALLVEHLPMFEPSSPLMSSLSKNFPTVGDFPRLLYGILYLAAYLICGRDVIKGAVRNIHKGNVFGEQFLMTVASVGAIFVGEFAEAVAVMLFYNLGEFVQDYAVDRSRDSISALMDIRPDRATVIREGKAIVVSPEEVQIGEIIEVKPGERLPLDGIIIEGKSFADTSALTGESLPREVSAQAQSEVLAGFVNQTGLLKIRVTKSYGESAVSRILNLTEKASEVKAKSEKFIARFARVYTPIVCFAALAVALLPPLFLQFFMPELFAKYGWSVWIYRALTFLVVSCPCALVISVPLAFFCGIGSASKYGVLIKGSNFVEILSKVKITVFDKTGTLTKGIFDVAEVNPANGMTADELLAIATHAESYSNHPISKSLKKAHHCVLCDALKIIDPEEISGFGIRAVVDGKKVCAGNEKFMENEKVSGFDAHSQNQNDKGSVAGTIIHVAVDGLYCGNIVISDQEKEDSRQTIASLKKLGIKKTVMLTGDRAENARLVAENLGIDTVYAELLPEDKVHKVEEIMNDSLASKNHAPLIFVGDGINDSPVLARADAGIAMGALGSDAAIEAADVVLMDDKPSRLVDAIKISRRTMSIVWQNIYFSIGIKVAIMALNAIGLGNMWLAVFGDVGVCILAVGNAARVLKK
ncbi:MAG: heavy metal translocating P-type ATPase [Treponema sp.]|uniref:heavy metal translocating P-type ATPase n=1 Tax=Treponema sp. TaxID=166 RepID=UPI0025E2D69B|nr:heavy metal translocating P-type ATPase [Treponema sp.]MBQ8678148.1 heavy metal translocating P-type ATPase [Treponema sp.]